jgi:hypothetical protein
MRANGEWSLVVPSWDSHRRAITTADRRSEPLPIDHDQQDEPGKRQKNGSPGSPFPPCVAAQITGPVSAASLLSDSGFAKRRRPWPDSPQAWNASPQRSPQTSHHPFRLRCPVRPHRAGQRMQFESRIGSKNSDLS